MTTATSTVTLRAATPEDREFLLGVGASTRAHELVNVPWTEAQKTTFLRLQAEAQDADYRSRNPELLVVCCDGADIGRLYRRESRHELRIMDIALLPPWQGRGIGTALLREILADADRRGLTVTLHVEQGNPARRLYERLGFSTVSQDQVYALLERSP